MFIVHSPNLSEKKEIKKINKKLKNIVPIENSLRLRDYFYNRTRRSCFDVGLKNLSIWTVFWNAF